MRSLKEYFHVNDKPIKVVAPGPPVKVDTKWKKLDDTSLTKTYHFDKVEMRNEFVVRCLALETHRGKKDVTWVVEANAVTVLFKIHQIGLTETIVEFAKILDDLRHDLTLASDYNEETFIF